AAFRSWRRLGKLASALGLAPIDISLHGGEDYELLVALPETRRLEGAIRSFREQFRTSLRRVATVTEGSGISIRESDGDVRPVDTTGFDHFG
ncbi:MAG: hypothetical protein AAF517_16565, partial [Planctomycetota bacterium]